MTYERVQVQPTAQRTRVINIPEHPYAVTPKGTMAEEWETLANQSLSLSFPQMPVAISSEFNLNYLHQFKLHSSRSASDVSKVMW